MTEACGLYEHWHAPRYLSRFLAKEGDLLLQGLNLFDERVDFFGSQLAGELGHVAFAVGDDVVQVVGGCGGGLCGDK
jgi:hypothetical protein